MINYAIGDATAPKGSGPKIIAHVCNDHGGWGAGFVLALSRRWKEPEDQYRRWSQSMSGGVFALGEVQMVAVFPELEVANMVAQRGYLSSDNQIPLCYAALRVCLRKVAMEAKAAGASVHMPRIGCGLAGGRWEEVAPIIQEELCGRGVVVWVYDLAKGNQWPPNRQPQQPTP